MTADHGASALVLWAEAAEAAAGIARALVGTAFAPESLKIRDPQTGRLDVDGSVAQITAALLTGQELGLPPMASLRAIDVIPPGSGSPALRAVALRGLLQQHGHDIWVVESTATRCVMRGRRFLGDGEYADPTEVTWTLDRVAKLAPRGFNDPKGPWKRQPQTMLIARATGEIARLIAADVVLGLPYLVEEIEPEDDYPDGQAATGAIPPPAKRTTTGRAATTRKRARPAAALPPAPHDGQGDAPGTDGAAAEGGATAPGESVPGITPEQRTALWAGMGDLGIRGRDPSLRVLSDWLGRQIGSSNDLTQAEAATALDKISAARDRAAADAAHDQAEAADPDPELPPEPADDPA